MTESFDQYAEKIRHKLHNIHNEAAKLAGKDSEKHPEKKLEYTQLMESLNIKRQQLEDKITEMQKADKDTRKGLEEELEILWKSVRRQYSEILSRLEHDHGGDSLLDQLPPR